MSPLERGTAAKRQGVVHTPITFANLTTPSAPSAQPPLLQKEGNTFSSSRTQETPFLN